MARKGWIEYSPNSAIYQLHKKHAKDDYVCSCGSHNLRRLKKGERVTEYMVRCQNCGALWIIEKECVHCGMSASMWIGCRMHVLGLDKPGASLVVCNRCLKEKHGLCLTSTATERTVEHPQAGKMTIRSVRYGLMLWS
jgi:hypothetical protein